MAGSLDNSVTNSHVSSVTASSIKGEEQFRLNEFRSAELTIQQESQKDFLFDPYAAAYYERFNGFKPDEKELDLGKLKWPALKSDDRYSQA